MISKPIIAFILLYLYFMIPKVDLFLIPGTVTGIRIQDFISLALFLILFDFRIHKYTLFVLIFMCYLANQLFENNENVHKKSREE